MQTGSDKGNSPTPTADTPILPTAPQPQALAMQVAANPNATLLQALITHLNKKLDSITTQLTTLKEQTGNGPHGAYDAYNGSYDSDNILHDYEDYNEKMQAKH